MRKLTLLLGCGLMAACSGSPTSGAVEVEGIHASYGGGWMGSGHRDGGSVTDTATSSAMGGHTMGGGAREGATVTDSTSGGAAAFGGVLYGSGN